MKTISFEFITSRKNARIISVCALADKKARDKEGLFCAEGIKLLRELLDENIKIDDLYFTEHASRKYETEISRACRDGAKTFCVTDEVYLKMSSEKNPEGILAVAKKFKTFETVCRMPRENGFLLLDAVQNPSNVGTVIRTACALGVRNVVLGAGCADVFGSKTIRAAMGALFKVNICIAKDICEQIKLLKEDGVRVFGTALCPDSKPINEISFLPTDAIVLGNEGGGISEDVLSLCDTKVIIPMHLGAESLNAASAATIFIWEKQKAQV